MPNTNISGGQGQNFVERTEMAIMQLVILGKAQQGEVTRDNLKQVFRGNLQMQGDHFEHCITQLVQENHLKEVGGNKYTITDDGREDIQKLLPLVLELPNVVNQGGVGGQQRQGIQQQTAGGRGTTGTTGGQTGGNVGGGNVGGSQQGSQGGGNVGGGQNRNVGNR